jgi:hypothetical protein
VNAWTDEDTKKPWGCEVAFLRHLANDPVMDVTRAAMLRHCASRIEATASYEGVVEMVHIMRQDYP